MNKDKLKIYSESEIKENLKSIRDGKEYELNIPLRVLRLSDPKEFNRAKKSAIQKTEQYRKKSRENPKNKQYNLIYSKASGILRKKHKIEFKNILNKLMKGGITDKNGRR